MLPLPTSSLEVSGINKNRMIRLEPDRMVKIQNTHCHESSSVRIPPGTGPRVGAAFVLGPSAVVKLHFSQPTSLARCRHKIVFPTEVQCQQENHRQSQSCLSC